MSAKAVYSYEKVIKKLPRREYFFASEVALAFGVERRTIHRISQNKGVGRKMRQGPRGTYIYELDDIQKLCYLCKGVRGNPNWT